VVGGTVVVGALVGRVVVEDRAGFAVVVVVEVVALVVASVFLDPPLADTPMMMNMTTTTAARVPQSSHGFFFCGGKGRPTGGGGGKWANSGLAVGDVGVESVGGGGRCEKSAGGEGGYHLPSDAIHHPGPCDPSLILPPP
jgi:hypothetical protein